METETRCELVRIARRAGGALLCVLCGCQEPTQATLIFETDVLCPRNESAIALGQLGPALEQAAPSALGPSCTTGANSTIGTLVVVPSDDSNPSFGVRAVLGIQKPTSACSASDAYAGCTIARRGLALRANEPLAVRIGLWNECVGQACAADQTCVRGGQCVSALIPDSSRCSEDSPCDEGVLLSGSPAGLACDTLCKRAVQCSGKPSALQPCLEDCAFVAQESPLTCQVPLQKYVNCVADAIASCGGAKECDDAELAWTTCVLGSTQCSGRGLGSGNAGTGSGVAIETKQALCQCGVPEGDAPAGAPCAGSGDCAQTCCQSSSSTNRFSAAACIKGKCGSASEVCSLAEQGGASSSSPGLCG